MLSKISLAINAILVIFVINLYIQNCNEEGEEAISTENDESIDNGMKIAFINTDTLDVNYLFTLDVVETLQKEMEKKQRRLERKATKLQQEYSQIQQSARTMTPTQLNAAQQRLMQMEQEIQSMQNDLANELAQQQNELQMDLIHRLDSFLIRYNSKRNYDYIIKKHASSDLLVANANYDITKEVLDLLNKEYLGENNATDSL
jgi:outer membrane protein